MYKDMQSESATGSHVITLLCGDMGATKENMRTDLLNDSRSTHFLHFTSNIAIESPAEGIKSGESGAPLNTAARRSIYRQLVNRVMKSCGRSTVKQGIKKLSAISIFLLLPLHSATSSQSMLACRHLNSRVIALFRCD